MRYVVDRFDDSIVVCEKIDTEEIFYINRLNLPKNLKEGDIVINVKGKFIVDEIETKRRYEKLNKIFKNLLKKNE